MLQIVVTLPKENNQSPVVHRVRVVGTFFLIVLHVICRWPLVRFEISFAFVWSIF